MGIQLEKCKFPDLPLPSQKSVNLIKVVNTSKFIDMSLLWSHSHVYSEGEEGKILTLQFIRYMKGAEYFFSVLPKKTFCSTI